MELGRELSKHRPRVLPFFMASVPLQISVENWLLSLPRQRPAKPGAKAEGQSAWELKVLFSPPPRVVLPGLHP